jgi:hypothetical protein
MASFVRAPVRRLEELEALLDEGSTQEVAPIPWQGWRLKREDFLLTRLIELVVHSDDLARSVDVPTPEFADDVFLPVIDLLTRLAVERHGQAPLSLDPRASSSPGAMTEGDVMT